MPVVPLQEQCYQYDHSTEEPGEDNYDALLNIPDIKPNISDCKLVYFHVETTGLDSSAEICQIAACCGDDKFSEYIYPTMKILYPAMIINGLTKEKGKLCLHGKPVETVSHCEAWQKFINFISKIGKDVIIVIHNVSFDSRFLLRDLTELGLIESFKKVCIGFLDTMKIFTKIAFPGRKLYTLTSIAQDVLGYDSNNGSHNAAIDVSNTQKLMQMASIEPESLVEYFISVTKLQQRKKLKLMMSEHMSDRIRRKVEMAGITYDMMKKVFRTEGKHGIESLLSKKISGKPRVTKNKKVIQNILDFFHDQSYGN